MKVPTYLILSSIVLSVSGFQDEYLDEAQRSCLKGHNTYSCLKYRSLKYLTAFTDSAKWPSSDNSTAPIKLVHLDHVDPEDAEAVTDDTGLLEDSRQLATDTELQKIVKFVKRHAKYFLMSHGVSLDLPLGARAVDDDGEVLNAVDGMYSYCSCLHLNT